MQTEAEPGVRQPQAQEHPKPPQPGKGKVDPPLEPQTERNTADTLTWALRSPDRESRKVRPAALSAVPR